MLILLQLRKLVPSLEVLQNYLQDICTWTIVGSRVLLAPTPSTASAMKNVLPEFPGYSTSLLETEKTPEKRERNLMPLNTQMELANWNTTLLSCATKVKRVLKEK